MRPRPPAAVTADASFPPAAEPIGASTIGCSMPRRSVSRVRRVIDSGSHASQDKNLPQLDTSGLDDWAVALEVATDAGFEFVERGDVGLAGTGFGQSVGEFLCFQNRGHLLAQLLDDVLRR